MKTPIYETSSGATLALLQSRAFVYADLYTFTLPSGPVLRYSAGDLDIGYGGNSWSSKSVRFDTDSSKATAHWKIGLDVDTWQVVVYPRPIDELTGAAWPDTIGSTPWLRAAVGGALDGALVTVDRAYFPSWPAPQAIPIAPTGVLRIFAGRVAEVDCGRSGAVISVNSHLELLNIQMPRNLYQAGCSHTLFDAGCTLVEANFSITGSVAAGSSQSTIVSTAVTPGGSGTYALGRVLMTSGANTGFGRSVRRWSGGVLTLMAPFYFPIETGDSFTAWPGCDKQFATCQAFSNQANFGGQRFIPAPETAI
jgi:hypothetical protein